MVSLFFYDDPAFSPPPDILAQILALYRDQGWWEGDGNPDALARLIAGSHCFLLALDQDRVVGMGRAISDRASDAYIQDVTVRKEYRGNRIGGRIVRTIVERLRADGLSWIGLIAEKGSKKFYEPFGFETMPDATPMLLSEK